MADPAPEGIPSGNQRNGDDQLAELRDLLVVPEASQLRLLQERLDNLSLTAEEVAGVLAEAIRLRSGRDPKLRTALQPILEESFKISVQKHPRMFVEILFPVIGPAIRKAVTAVFQNMLESLNQTMEQSFSLRGLQWRLEAWRSGRSFPEVVVLRSMLYKVEQVFLIHRDTGLLLEHRVSGSAVVKDPALVSGMLTAIHDFVGDSFGASGGDELETMRVGEYVVWIQHGPRALLACLVQGVAPPQLKFVFVGALEKIHQDLGGELAAFKGDAAPFEAARPHLDSCLLGRLEAKPKSGYRTAIAVCSLVLILLAALGIWQFRERRKWWAAVERLSGEPGIAVTRAEAGWGAGWGKYTVYGLRDPLSGAPEKIVQAGGIDPAKVAFHWEPYESAHPRFAAVRTLERQKERVEKYSVFFRTGSSEVSLDSTAVISVEISALLRSAADAHRTVSIQVLGYTDHQGSLAYNAALAKERAERTAAELIRQGVGAQFLSARGEGQGSAGDAALERRVLFRVTAGP
jgi:outer membrane protein OmpA-like peptidoglycan-associated protein